MNKRQKNLRKEKVFKKLMLIRDVFILNFILIFFIGFSFGQKDYYLGKYKVNPTEKKIWELQRFTENIDGGGQAWGEKYVLDTTIIYDSTTLYVIGSQFFFKESIPRYAYLSDKDLNTLEVMHIEIENYDRSLCRDKDYLYRNRIGNDELPGRSLSISLAGYTAVNDYVYQKEKELYFLSSDFKLKKIENLRLDAGTLTHVMGNFFTDKKGLYLLGGYYKREIKAEKTERGLTIYNIEWENDFVAKSVKIDKNKGEKSIPEIKKNYFIYNQKVYSQTGFNDHLPLPLDLEKMKEIDVKYVRYGTTSTILLADDKNAFVTNNNNSGYTTLESRYHNYWFVDNEFFRKDVNQWQVISRGDLGIFKDEDGKSLYFASEIKKANGNKFADIVINKKDVFYTFKMEEKDSLRKFEKVFTFNFDTQENEELDLSQYQYLGENIWIYKKRLFMYSDGISLPIKDVEDTENLRYITHHNSKTNFLQNEKSLIFIGKFGGVSTIGEGGNKMQVLGKRILIADLDYSSLKVLTADVLMDKDNIYVGKYNGISVIPIKALGLDVKVFTE